MVYMESHKRRQPPPVTTQQSGANPGLVGEVLQARAQHITRQTEGTGHAVLETKKLFAVVVGLHELPRTLLDLRAMPERSNPEKKKD